MPESSSLLHVSTYADVVGHFRNLPRIIEEIKCVLPRRREGQADVGGDQVDEEEECGRDRDRRHWLQPHVEFGKCSWALARS